MRLRLEEEHGLSTQTFTGTGTWQRISVTRTLATSPGYAQLSVILNGSATITYYVDGYRSSSADTTAVVYHDDYRVTEEFFSSPPN